MIFVAPFFLHSTTKSSLLKNTICTHRTILLLKESLTPLEKKAVELLPTKLYIVFLIQIPIERGLAELDVHCFNLTHKAPKMNNDEFANTKDPD